MNQIPEPSDYIAVVGRVADYIKDPNRGTLPVSCTITAGAFDATDFDHVSRYVCAALVGGAGINVHLDKFAATPNLKDGKLYFFLSPNHSEYERSKDGRAKPLKFLDFTFAVNTGDPLLDFTPRVQVSDSILETDQDFRELNGKSLTRAPSIMDCVNIAFHTGRNGESIEFDLSGLRDAKHTNPKGLVSSGAKSFAYLLNAAYQFGQYSSLTNLLYYLSSYNAVLRRGGAFKNGAITTSLPFNHPAITKYLTIPKELHPWLKKGVSVHSDWLTSWTADPNLIKLVQVGINNGSIWLEKIVSPLENGGYRWHSSIDITPNRLFSNVCREILIPVNGTCNLTHVNLGMVVNPDELPKAFTDTMTFLLSLHGYQDTSKYYLKSDQDRQVGMGVIGLANMLGNMGVTYKQFVKALKVAVALHGGSIRKYATGKSKWFPEPNEDQKVDAQNIAYWLCRAFAEAGRIAHDQNFDRAFTIAPTASSSFRYTDYLGFTTTPEISPPLGQETERLSEVEGNESIDVFYGDVETLKDVGSDVYFDLADTWQKLMECTTKAHSISFNVTEDCTFEFLQKWSESNLLTTYYRVFPVQDHLDKSSQFQGKDWKLNCACTG